MANILLVDGDVVCHAACGQAWQIKLSQFKQQGLDLKALYGAREIPGYDPLKDPWTLDRCWREFKKEMSEMQDALFSTDVVMAIKAPTNFRDDVYSLYKAKRNSYRVPNPFVDMIRDRAVEEGYGIHAHGREADDYLRIWAEECRRFNRSYVVSSVDKDLYCIPGKHWNIKKKELMDISEKEAMHHYYAQLLQGDSTDNIPGLPGIGPKKAWKALEACDDHDECQTVVVEMYVEAYGAHWESHLLSNGKLIHIQKTLNDYFTLGEWGSAEFMRDLIKKGDIELETPDAEPEQARPAAKKGPAPLADDYFF